MLPPPVLSALEPDLKLLARQDVLGELDIRRAEIVQKWQARAKGNPDYSYEVRPQSDTLPKVRISREKGITATLLINSRSYEQWRVALVEASP